MVFTEAEDIDIPNKYHLVMALIEDGIVDNFFQRLIVATGEKPSLPQLPAWASLGAHALDLLPRRAAVSARLPPSAQVPLRRLHLVLDRSEYCGRSCTK